MTGIPEATMAATLKALTPVLIVDHVEPCAAFWVDRLGFTKSSEVPGDDGTLVFCILQKDGVEIMYQTKASVIADAPSQEADLVGHSTALFITVPSMDDLDAIEHALAGVPVVKPRHTTFYGSTEFYVREPGGNVVGFAAF
ncbi:MAG TPA: VOC family protein [Gemmatimonadaceae bacterium]|nr:VOC family protein [Gemmatimonadaceae bacterium]